MYLYEGGEMNAYNRHKTIEAQAQWQKEQNYTHFGTATFNFINTLNEEKALKTLSYFFNCVDRQIYKHKGVKEGKRVKRMVYLEKGRSRENLHTHFFYKADTFEEAEQIGEIMKGIWQSKIKEANDIQIIDNTKAKDNRHAYAMKEHYKVDDDIYQPKLSVL